MYRTIRNLSLAIAFGGGTLVALIGALRGLHVGELAMIIAVTITVLFVLVRALAGYYAGLILRKLAEQRSTHDARRLLGP